MRQRIVTKKLVIWVTSTVFLWSLYVTEEYDPRPLLVQTPITKVVGVIRL